jgi:hypothetical protein
VSRANQSYEWMVIDDDYDALGGLIVSSDQGGCGREGVQMGHFGR